MLRRCVEPYLRALSKEVIVSHDIMTFGMGESSVDQLLHDRMVRMVNPTLATYAKPCEVRLRATAKAAGAEEAEAMLAPVVAEVRAALGDYVYGVDVKGLEAVCFQLLKGAESHPVHCGELHRRPGGGADHCPARRLQRIPGRRGQLLDLCQGGGAGRAPGNAGPVRRRVGGHARAMAEGARRITGQTSPCPSPAWQARTGMSGQPGGGWCTWPGAGRAPSAAGRTPAAAGGTASRSWPPTTLWTWSGGISPACPSDKRTQGACGAYTGLAPSERRLL